MPEVYDEQDNPDAATEQMVAAWGEPGRWTADDVLTLADADGPFTGAEDVAVLAPF